MKMIVNYYTGQVIRKIRCTYAELYDIIGNTMPKGSRWVVDTGKRQREYFWFRGNKYQGDQLCWIGRQY